MIKIMLMALVVLYGSPALASSGSSDDPFGQGTQQMRRVDSAEREKLLREQEEADEHMYIKRQASKVTHNTSSFSCWQRSKPFVIMSAVLVACGGAVVGGIYGWSIACQNLLANNGTSYWCASNNTNSTEASIPWGGIP